MLTKEFAQFTNEYVSLREFNTALNFCQNLRKLNLSLVPLEQSLLWEPLLMVGLWSAVIATIGAIIRYGLPFQP